MRIFLLGKSRVGQPSSWGLDLFARALIRHHDVIYYGKNYNIGYNNIVPVPEILKQYRQKIDLIVCHLGYAFTGMAQVTNIPKVHILGDYGSHGTGTSNYEGYDEHLKSCGYDMIIVYTSSICKFMKDRKVAPIVQYLPAGVDTYLFHDRNLSRHIDVMASFASRRSKYPHRKDVQNLIKSMGIKYFTSRVNTWTYIDVMNRSKMFANANHLLGTITHKCLEAMVCRTMLLTEKLIDMESHGYVDGEHLVVYDGMKDLEEKIRYYLEHEDERKEIAKKGMEHVRENYSNDKMVEKFTEMVTENLFGGKAR